MPTKRPEGEMKLDRPSCPVCGKPAVGTVDQLQGVAFFDREATEGEVMYSGDTNIDWNSQKAYRNVRNPKEVLVTCEDFHDWFTEIEGLEE